MREQFNATSNPLIGEPLQLTSICFWMKLESSKLAHAALTKFLKETLQILLARGDFAEAGRISSPRNGTLQSTTSTQQVHVTGKLMDDKMFLWMC